MISDRKTTPLGEIILTLYVIGYIILSVLPMAKYSISYIVSGSYCLSFLLYYYFKAADKGKFLVIVIILLLFGAIQGVIAYLNGNALLTEIINEPIRVLRILVPCFIFSSVSGCFAKTKMFLWIFITALFVYISVTTLIGLSSDEMLARRLASGSQDESLMIYRLQNIGGFEFSYALGFMLPLFLLLIFNTRSVAFKIFSIALIIFIFYFVLSTQYMTLFIMVVISIFLVIILGTVRLRTKIIGICALSLFLLLASTVLRWIASLDIGVLANQRLMDLADFLDGNINVEDMTSRFDLFRDAFGTFLENPLTGQMNSTASAKSHSLVFGTAASVGILGLVFLVTEFVIYYKTSAGTIKTNNSSLKSFHVCYFCYILLAFLNPIGYAYEIAIVVFLYVPLTTCLFFNGKNNVTTSRRRKF